MKAYHIQLASRGKLEVFENVAWHNITIDKDTGNPIIQLLYIGYPKDAVTRPLYGVYDIRVEDTPEFTPKMTPDDIQKIIDQEYCRGYADGEKTMIEKVDRLEKDLEQSQNDCALWRASLDEQFDKKRNRNEGFYRIKWDGKWRIAEYCNSKWYLTQCLSIMTDNDLEEIDELIILIK